MAAFAPQILRNGRVSGAEAGLEAPAWPRGPTWHDPLR